MKAIGFKTSYNIENEQSLFEFEKDKPIAQGFDILVKINAVSMNPVDTKVRIRAATNTVLDEPKVLGYDAVGIVEEIGCDVKNLKINDRVFYAGDITRDGSNTQYQLVDSRIAALAPKTINDVEAAVFPLTSLTAWEAIFDRLKINKTQNKTILIIGGAGGVGSIAIQIVKATTNLTVIATASREESFNWVKSMGADYIANHRDLINSVKELGFDNVDYIFNVADTKGHWDAMSELIAPQGSICSIVEFDGALDFSILKSKSATFVWEFMFTRSMYKTDDIEEQHNILKQIATLIDEGKIKTTLTQTIEGFSVESIKKAHKIVESGKSIGKIAIDFTK
ncbi:zinc-binding alcohol dehydrogenase family protein [bacterium]|nr:zinc-binding alcohol dehydrogenase family protein [bacterium]